MELKINIINDSLFITVLKFLNIRNYSYDKDMFENFHRFKIQNVDNLTAFRIAYYYQQLLQSGEDPKKILPYKNRLNSTF